MDIYASPAATLEPLAIDDKTRAAVAAALGEIGVTDSTLTAEEKASLDRDGYVVMPGVLSKEEAAALARSIEAIAAKEGENAGKDFHTEAGATRLGTLINKDPLFDVCIFHPRSLAAVNYIMEGNFGLSSITARAAMPGEGHQVLHRDHGDFPSANALWVLSDFTEENGPTRLIPGSHLWTKEQEPEDKMAPHPQQIRMIAPAGTLIVINGRTWHGGTRNGTDKARHLCSAFFTRRNDYQGIAHRKLTPESDQRINAARKVILDFEDTDPA